jgi:hypothetical protein
MDWRTYEGKQTKKEDKQEIHKLDLVSTILTKAGDIKEDSELDLIIKKAENSLAIEIKSAKTFHDSFLENLNYYEKLFPENTESLGIIYDGDLDQKRKNIEVISFNSLNKFIKKAII